MQADLSIVILVYKTAHLLPRCLDSLMNSSGYDAKRVEFVVVSDASPDNCDVVVEKYQNLHSEIKYVKRLINGGEAAARNTGLENITGRYYTYVDSDDTVTDDYLKKILDVIEHDAPDVITYQYHTCNPEGRHLAGSVGMFDGCRSIDGSREDRRKIFSRFAMSLRCNAVIRRDMMQGVRYADEYKLGQDALYNFEAFLRAKKFAWISNIIYNYYQYSESATHNFDQKRVSDLLRAHVRYLEEIEKLAYYDEIADLVFGFFHMNYASWILDEVIRLGDDSSVAMQLKVLYLKVLDRARKDGVIGVFKWRLMKKVLSRSSVGKWRPIKKIFYVETQMNRVANRVRRLCRG